jgi:hypothetical protein
MKKQNLVVLMYIVFLSVLTSCFATMPNSWSEFFLGLGVSFCFWMCMLIGVFDFEKESNYSKEGWNEKYNR